MTEKNPALFLQAGSHPAEDFRRLTGLLVADAATRGGAGDLLVTATTLLGVSVAGGRVFIPGTENTYQGTYFAENRGATTLSHDPADASLDRIDLIVAKVQDAAYSGAVNAWSLVIVKGTNAAPGSAVAPAAPANSVALAHVSVTHGLTTITSAQITDFRPPVYGQGADWTLYTPAFTAGVTNPVLGTGGRALGRYFQTGKYVEVQVLIVFGTSGASAGSGTYAISLPVPPAAGLDVSGSNVTYIGNGALFSGSALSVSREISVVQRPDGTTFMRYIDSSGAAVTVADGTPLSFSVDGIVRFTARYRAA